MILSITVLLLLVMQVSLIPQEDSNLLLDYNDLYQDITSGQYDSAIKNTVKLKTDGRGHIITLIVNRLLDESQKNVIDYALNLAKNGEVTIVFDHFPIQFRWIVRDKEITFINRRDRMALKLAWNPGDDGDRGAFGDRDEWDGKRMAWKIIPYWYEGAKVYFEILNVHFKQYLKLKNKTDDVGDHKGFADSNHGSRIHLWYFRPVLVESEMLFYIINVEYNQTLKLGSTVDTHGDRTLWGDSGNPVGNPELFAWYLRLHSEYEKKI